MRWAITWGRSPDGRTYANGYGPFHDKESLQALRRAEPTNGWAPTVSEAWDRHEAWLEGLIRQAEALAEDRRKALAESRAQRASVRE